VKLAGGIPLFVAVLSTFGVAACSGSSGSSGPPRPSGTCSLGTIYYTTNTSSGPDNRIHDCISPNHCSVDPATGSARCDDTGQPGAPPFWTCHTAADCTGAKFCTSWGNKAVTLLGSPQCVEGVCDWQAQTPQPCTGGFVCFRSECGTLPNTTGAGGDSGVGNDGGP
jgi:hypothetical protein